MAQAGQELATNKRVAVLKQMIDSESVQQQFRNALRDNAGPFVASVLDLYSTDSSLQECSPSAVLTECLKAAVLQLPLNKQLGFAYVVPYKKVPTFILGYKGYVQLAMRTGKYRTLNAGILYDGMTVRRDILTGKVAIDGEPKSDKATAIGYFCHFELLNGFSKTLYMTKDECTAWGKRYSKSFSHSSSPWKSNFDEMALKTCVRRLISKWGILSVEMQQALETDSDAVETSTREVIQIHANTGEIIDTQVIDEAPAELPAGACAQRSDATCEQCRTDGAACTDPAGPLSAPEALPGF
jgi:recombination protein RecT